MDQANHDGQEQASLLNHQRQDLQQELSHRATELKEKEQVAEQALAEAAELRDKLQQAQVEKDQQSPNSNPSTTPVRR